MLKTQTGQPRTKRKGKLVKQVKKGVKQEVSRSVINQKEEDQICVKSA